MILSITGLSNDGRGIARTPDGRIVFAEGALPGDTVQARIVSSKSDYREATVLEVLEPSDVREQSVCPFAAQCGGCPLMCMKLDAQRKFKQESFENALLRVESTARVLEPVFGSRFGYRSRARFRYSLENGVPRLGFMEGNSNTDVLITSCPVADRALNEFISKPPRLNVWELKDRQLSCITTDSGVLYGAGTGYITVSAASQKRVLPVSNSVFFQSNLELLPAMMDEVVSLTEGCDVMDLYSGVGTFSAFLEDSFNVTAVEMNKNCLSLAKQHLKKTQFFTSAVEKWKGTHRKVDTVIVDPPRTGLDKTVPALITSFNPSRIIYVSCFQTTLMRDLERFKALGWKVEQGRLFDFYPNTPHVETVVILSGVKTNSHISVKLDVEKLNLKVN